MSEYLFKADLKNTHQPIMMAFNDLNKAVRQAMTIWQTLTGEDRHYALHEGTFEIICTSSHPYAVVWNPMIALANTPFKVVPGTEATLIMDHVNNRDGPYAWIQVSYRDTNWRVAGYQYIPLEDLKSTADAMDTMYRYSELFMLKYSDEFGRSLAYRNAKPDKKVFDEE